MGRKFSKMSDNLKDSCIMELISVASEPGMVSFATGLPDMELFDPTGIAEAAADVLGSDVARASLQYGDALGHMPLREKISERLRREAGLSVEPERIVLTNGSQECFDLLGKLFLDRGDGLAVENPGYLGALQSFSAYGPEFHGVDVGEGGPSLDGLRDALSKRPRMFYCIPNHQNPTGYSYGDDARSAVADLLDGTGTLLVEDDAYGELGHRGRVGKAISSMAENAVFTGSFSKMVSPGMRVGWMALPDWILPKASAMLEASCLQAGSFSQWVIDRFLEIRDYDAHLDRQREAYLGKKNRFLELLSENMPPGVEWNDPSGGMFVWMRLPRGVDADALRRAALSRKLVLMPGKPFHVRGGGNTIRLNYATATPSETVIGMEALGAAARETL